MIKDAVGAAFQAILDQSPEALAKAQCELYGQKPWRYPYPECDALGRRIMYADAVAGRYTVHDVRSDGAHVRREYGAPTFIGQVTSIVARGPTLARAQEVANIYAAGQGLELASPGPGSGGGISTDYAWLRFIVRRKRI